MNAAHWVWAGTGFMSFNYAVPSSCHAEFENEDQFKIAAAKIAREAASKAELIEDRFTSLAAIREFVVAEAHESDRMRPSWFGYYAAIASGLEGRLDDAAYFFDGLTDERVTKHSDGLVAEMGSQDSFRTAINQRITQQREALKLPPLDRNPF